MAEQRLPMEAEFREWLEHPVTRAHQDLLRRWREGLKEQWAAGVFSSSRSNETHAANLQALGQVAQLDQLLKLDYEEFIEGLRNEDE